MEYEKNLGRVANYAGASGLGTYKNSTGMRLGWILTTQELEFLDYRILPDVVAEYFAVYAEIKFREQQ